MSHLLELTSGQQRKIKGGLVPPWLLTETGQLSLWESGVCVCAEKREGKTVCVCIPEAGLGPPYPTGLSFLSPSSIASALCVRVGVREKDRERDFKCGHLGGKSLRFNYRLNGKH